MRDRKHLIAQREAKLKQIKELETKTAAIEKEIRSYKIGDVFDEVSVVKYGASFQSRNLTSALVASQKKREDLLNKELSELKESQEIVNEILGDLDELAGAIKKSGASLDELLNIQMKVDLAVNAQLKKEAAKMRTKCVLLTLSSSRSITGGKRSRAWFSQLLSTYRTFITSSCCITKDTSRSTFFNKNLHELSKIRIRLLPVGP